MLRNLDDDGGGGLEGTEHDYDALNFETFDSAINGDWEDIHDNLVRLDRNSDIKDDNGESDLELNLSRVGMDDFDVAKEDNEGRVQLDPSVWANPYKSPAPQNHVAPAPTAAAAAASSTPVSVDSFGFYRNPDAFLRQHFPNPFAAQQHPPSQQSQLLNQQQHQQLLQQHHLQQQQQQQLHMQQQHQQQMQILDNIKQMPPNMPHKIMSVEDIERNIRNQQKQQQQQQQQQQQNQTPTKQGSATATGTGRSQTPQLQQTQRPPLQQQQPLPPQPPPQPAVIANNLMMHQRITAPPSIIQQQMPPPPLLPKQLNGPNGMPNFTTPPPHHQISSPKQPLRLPPGFPPMQLMGPHAGMPGNIGSNGVVGGAGVVGSLPHPANMPRPMPHNLPVALNNFAMHPNFNAMRPNMPLQRMQQPPPQLMSPHFPPHMQNLQNTVNQFNQRLVQEIQLNHPMLPFNRMNNNNFNNGMMTPMQHAHMNAHHAMNGVGGGNKQMQQHQQQQPQQNFRANGNLNDDYDDYANLMSNRDKQWLISIQLSQLNTGTPYIDDYYYTVFKERKSNAKGERENKAHKDNQMNHPFSQPKGHGHLVLITMGNKNTNHQHHQRANNHHNNRERKNSESNKDKDQTPRTYTPLQFENSLGKLQCGSVTAPRKIIDMDVVGAESSSPFSTTIEISAQRKSRQLLIHIETLYRILLKLEDLENPIAIATSLIVRERKERERQLAMEQQQLIENASAKDSHGNITLDSAGNSLRSSLSLGEKEEEGRDELLLKLLAGLTVEKVVQMMSVRKGKTLLRRALPLIAEPRNRWDVWHGILSTLPVLMKKDKDDQEGLLYAFFPEFKKQIQHASMVEIVKVANAIALTDKTSPHCVLVNKFCVSCIIVLVLQAEMIYSQESPAASTEAEWLAFLGLLSGSASVIAQSLSLGATAIQSDIIKPLVCHFSRFRELKSQQLLAVLTQESC